MESSDDENSSEIRTCGSVMFTGFPSAPVVLRYAFSRWARRPPGIFRAAENLKIPGGEVATNADRREE